MAKPTDPQSIKAALQQLLSSHWGHPAFRPLQEEIIISSITGKDTLALLPTGGGKSICYQIPALYNDGLCLVVSPLIALMNDQVRQLRKKNITAFAIQSGMNRSEVKNVLTLAAESNCKLLYVSPERLGTPLFKEYLLALDIRLIAVDEAHCISQWGYDFRPSYLQIAELRAELPDVPVLALTASATPEVQDDIREKLLFREGHNVFRQNFERPNLSYSAEDAQVKVNRILEILRKVPGSSLIYCKSRKRCQEICNTLRTQGIKAAYYHAGLTREERSSRQEAWLRNEVQTMVCTNAFGMGIDKPDVRLVLHADLPDCLENYYQEAGRAGRDGARSYAVLLYRPQELSDLKASLRLRFPDIKEIRNIYQSIVNYLQLPSGHGEGQTHDFELEDFIKRFHHHPHEVLAVLKILEQEGLLHFNEQVYTPSKLQFICDKRYLNEIESAYPELVPLIQHLLRHFEGLFDHPSSLSEKSLAYHLRIEEKAVTGQLKWLHQRAVVHYEPQKEKPRIYFLQHRVAASSLNVDLIRLQKRKEQWEKRIDRFAAYVMEKLQCRSQYISAYFGAAPSSPCGICDNCIAARKRPLEGDAFRMLREKILEQIRQQPQSATVLVGNLQGVNRERILEALNVLQSEQELEQDNAGILRLPGTR